MQLSAFTMEVEPSRLVEDANDIADDMSFMNDRFEFWNTLACSHYFINRIQDMKFVISYQTTDDQILIMKEMLRAISNYKRLTNFEI